MLQSKKRFRIRPAPANLGSGFDALGSAWRANLRIALEPAEQLNITVIGRNVDRIPTNMRTTLFIRSAQKYGKTTWQAVTMFDLWIDNEIPLARGMGSSAAAEIIAGITCYELLTGDQLNEQELFAARSTFEDHPDNLGACLYGGLIAGVSAGRRQRCRLRDFRFRAGFLHVCSHFLLSNFRQVWPDRFCRRTYSFHDIIYNTQRSALTIAALTTCNKKLLREAMRDRIHQPYRAKLIPGLEEILELHVDGSARSGAERRWPDRSRVCRTGVRQNSR
jgi:homoserine kinase